MAEAIIHLVRDPDTERSEILVEYRSDEDATPFEHEREHRGLVERLLPAGLLDAVEGLVERVRPAVEAVPLG